MLCLWEIKCFFVDVLQDKRFHNWLENARDWAISRSRFWGTPIPIWISEDGEEIIVMDSIGKLEMLSGVKVSLSPLPLCDFLLGANMVVSACLSLYLFYEKYECSFHWENHQIWWFKER